MFPGSSATVARFPLRFVELTWSYRELGQLNVEAFEVNHTAMKAGRFSILRRIKQTDTREWINDSSEFGRDADLLIAEACFFDRRCRSISRLHLS